MAHTRESSSEPSHCHRLKKMRVHGGFLDGAVFDFDDQLNCLIGPRGSGKSTALELVRFVFDLGPSDDSVQARRRFENMIKENLGGAQGRVEVEVETQEGLCFTVHRQFDEEPIILDEDGEATDLDLRAGALFRPEIFSQNDVESIADQPTYQRDLLDSFRAQEIDEAMQAIRLEEGKLRQNGLQIGKLEDEIERLGEQVKTLPGLVTQLKGLSKSNGSNMEEINKAHALKSQRDKDERAMAKAVQVLARAREQFSQDLETLQREAKSVYGKRPDDDPNNAQMADHQTRFREAVTEVGKDIKGVMKTLELARHDLEEKSKALGHVHQKQELEFSNLMEKHNALTAKTKERVDLEKRRNELEQKKRELTELKERLEQLQQQREEILDALSDSRDKRFNIRREVAQSITAKLKGNIQVEVLQNGERSAYEALLSKLLQSAGVQRNVVADKLKVEFTPWELADYALRKDKEGFLKVTTLSQTQAEKAFAALIRREAILELEAVQMDDQPTIKLKEGDIYKDSATLSTGQKCTTILPILLLDSEKPLLIDQPEDNLDNSFVYSDVVTGIRAAKSTRQLVFVTHNPNIPVLGEAERIFVLHSDGRSASLSHRGNVDECKEPIVKLLEGGEDAFKERKRRYHY